MIDAQEVSMEDHNIISFHRYFEKKVSLFNLIRQSQREALPFIRVDHTDLSDSISQHDAPGNLKNYLLKLRIARQKIPDFVLQYEFEKCESPGVDYSDLWSDIIKDNVPSLPPYYLAFHKTCLQKLLDLSILVCDAIRFIRLHFELDLERRREDLYQYCLSRKPKDFKILQKQFKCVFDDLGTVISKSLPGTRKRRRFLTTVRQFLDLVSVHGHLVNTSSRSFLLLLNFLMYTINKWRKLVENVCEKLVAIDLNQSNPKSFYIFKRALIKYIIFQRKIILHS